VEEEEYIWTQVFPKIESYVPVRHKLEEWLIAYLQSACGKLYLILRKKQHLVGGGLLTSEILGFY
jgi:hypothetical protein